MSDVLHQKYEDVPPDLAPALILAAEDNFAVLGDTKLVGPDSCICDDCMQRLVDLTQIDMDHLTYSEAAEALLEEALEQCERHLARLHYGARKLSFLRRAHALWDRYGEFMNPEPEMGEPHIVVVSGDPNHWTRRARVT